MMVLLMMGVMMCEAWVPTQLAVWSSRIQRQQPTTLLQSTSLAMSGSLHGQNACFLPLKQLDQDYYAPRIIQVRNQTNFCLTLQ